MSKFLTVHTDTHLIGAVTDYNPHAKGWATIPHYMIAEVADSCPLVCGDKYEGADLIVLSINTLHFQIEVTLASAHGWFEHHRLGDECGGGLWFEGKALRDYDGVFELSREIINALTNAGFDMSYATDSDEEESATEEMQDAATEFGVPYSPVLLIADENGLLALPNGDLLICRYAEGDCDTINAAEPDPDNLRRALFDARECGEIRGNCSTVTLPFGGTFLID